MAFNTIFQLVAGRDADWNAVDTILLMPDLMSYWLSGRRVAEMTMASTTGLLDVAARTWSERTCAHLAERYGLPVPRVLPELVEPGTTLGPTTDGLFSVPVQVIAVCGQSVATTSRPRSRPSRPVTPAPGRWSASSSSSRCSPRPAGPPTSPTSSASTARCAP